MFVYCEVNLTFLGELVDVALWDEVLDVSLGHVLHPAVHGQPRTLGVQGEGGRLDLGNGSRLFVIQGVSKNSLFPNPMQTILRCKILEVLNAMRVYCSITEISNSTTTPIG